MSLEKMDELFGITDDLLKIMDERQRGRAESRTAAGPASLFTAATTVVVPGEMFEKRNTEACRSRNTSPVYHV